jgi:hypothetical protein
MYHNQLEIISMFHAWRSSHKASFVFFLNCVYLKKASIEYSVKFFDVHSDILKL